jgi:hypothetical protein
MLTGAHSFSETACTICQTAFSLLMRSIGLATVSRTSHVIDRGVTTLCSWVTASQLCSLTVHRVYRYYQHRAIVFCTSLGTGRTLQFGWLVIYYHLGAFTAFLFSMTLFAEPRRQSFRCFKDRYCGHCEGQPRGSYP